MFLKWIKRVTLLVCCIDLYGASIVDVPLKNEQQRQIYEQNQNVDTNIPKSDLRKPIDIPPSTPVDENCFLTHDILIHGSTLLSKTEKERIVERYTGKCNGVGSLSILVKELSAKYIEHGYITSRVYITPQDISDGVVDVYAIEGRIEKIESNNLKTSGAFIFLEGNVLDLTDLESALEQVNRLRSNTTTMSLLPGETSGTSRVILSTQESLPFFGSFGTNNYGSDATGKMQFFGGFTWENFFGFSDILSLNINTTDKHQTGQNSIGNSAVYSIPLGKWLWEASISRFRYEQTITGLNEDFISKGVSDSIALGTTYKLHHTRSYNVELSGRIAHKNNESSINGAMIESSTYDISVATIGMKYVYRRSSWEIYLLPDHHKGLNIYSPTNDRILKHDFSKWTLAAGGTKYFHSPSPISYQFSAYAQYSDDLLYSIEQISIGGAYSVRGFQKQTISGSKGWYARNDLVLNANPYFSPYFAYDAGHINSGIDTAGGTLTSMTLGFRSRYKAFILDVYHAIPLRSPNETFDTDPFIGISLSANF